MKLINLLFAIPLFTIVSCNSHDDGIQYPEGGYNFPRSGNKNDAGCFPPAGQIPESDSFYWANHEPYFFKLFDEPDLSVEPSPKTLFRLTFRETANTYVISLTKDSIIVKKGEGRYRKDYDFSKLTKQEIVHYRILRVDYPIDTNKPTNLLLQPPVPPETFDDAVRRHEQLDAIRKNTPLLLKTEYYDYLEKKVSIKAKDPLTYSTRQMKITDEEFMHFVKLLNQSAYWTLPYLSYCCDCTHANWYSLEANTGKKYNYVGSDGPCAGDTTAFHQACQLLIDMAHIDARERVYYKPER